MIVLKRYKIKALQYQHWDESHLMQDFRENKAAKPELRHIHYLGYEIRSAYQARYHHATFLADSLESLCQAITSIRKNLRRRLSALDTLMLVFIRSYLTIDQTVFDLRTQDSMREEMELRLGSKRIDHFMAYGQQFDGAVQQIQVKAPSAIEAYGRLQNKIYKSDCKNKLTFLGAYSAHPVTAEYTEHFDYAKDRLKLMINESVEWKTCIVH